MPIEEYNGLNNQIAKLKEDIHKYTVEGKVKVKYLKDFPLFKTYYMRRCYCNNYYETDLSSIKVRGLEIYNSERFMTEDEFKNLESKALSDAIADIYKFKEELMVEVGEATQKTKAIRNMNFMQRLVYLFRGRL